MTDDELLAQIQNRRQRGDISIPITLNAIESIFKRHRAEVERLTRETQVLRNAGVTLLARAESAESALAAANERIDKLVIEAGAYDDLLAEMRQRAEKAESALAAERKRCGELEALAREVAHDDGTRDTVTERNAFPFFSKLNQRMCMLRDKARAALAGKDAQVTNDQRG